MELSYDEIRKIHRLEKSTSQLVELESDFYNELHSFLKTEKDKYLDSLKDFSISNTRDFTNLKKMVEEIFSLREKKILSKALIVSRTKEFSDTSMTSQEKKVFKKILGILEDHNVLLHELFETEGTLLSSDSSTESLDELQVKIVEDVPSFVGYDMKEYGPFSKGEVVKLPIKIGKLLNSRDLAVVEG